MKTLFLLALVPSVCQTMGGTVNFSCPPETVKQAIGYATLSSSEQQLLLDASANPVASKLIDAAIERETLMARQLTQARLATQVVVRSEMEKHTPGIVAVLRKMDNVPQSRLIEYHVQLEKAEAALINGELRGKALECERLLAQAIKAQEELSKEIHVKMMESTSLREAICATTAREMRNNTK